MIEILNFTNNNETYYLFFKEKFICAKKVNDKLLYNLTESEINLIRYVFSQVIPTNNTVDLYPVSFHNKKFTHLFDTVNNLHVFYEEKQLPCLEDFVSLNILYNSRPEYIASYDSSSGNENKQKEKAKNTRSDIIKGSIKAYVKGMIIGSVISVTVVLPSLHHLAEKSPDELYSFAYYKQYDQESNNPNAYTIDVDTNIDTIDVDTIIDSIKSNPNTSDIEKELFLSFQDFFEDQLPYLSAKDVIDNQSKLHIDYISDSNEESNGSVKATWSVAGEDIYSIKVYESTGLNDNNISDVIHEGFHTFTDKFYVLHRSIDGQFYEFLNTVMAHEYTLYEDDSYSWLYNYSYLMLELFDEETLREYHAKPRLNNLIDKLEEIIPDRDMAYNLFYVLNEYDISCRGYYKLDEELAKQKTEEEWHEDLISWREILKSYLKDYYEAKYECNIDDDIYIYFLYDSESAIIKLLNDDSTVYLEASEDEIIESLDIYMKHQSKSIVHPNYFNKRVEKKCGLILQFGDGSTITIIDEDKNKNKSL